MDWDSIFSVIMAILVAIGLPLALRKRKKARPQKREELYSHLREIGVKASLAEKGDNREKIGLGRASGQKSEGTIALEGKNIDTINVISVASQYGTSYFLDYLVKSLNIMGERMLKKTKLIRKRSRPFWGGVVAIEWKGDESLAQSLGLDYSLEDKLLRSARKDFKGSIWIFPEPKHGYARIRTAYSLPSTEAFEAINTVAKHIRSW
jgi:hypothetical protein